MNWRELYVLWMLKLVTLLVLIVFVFPVGALITLSVLSSLGGSSPVPGEKEAVAVIQLEGVIENTNEIVDELYKQAYNESIRGIVLAVDSPGGAAGPSQAVFHAVKKLKEQKPIVAVMGNVAASGGLYVSLSASKILAQPSTQTGSIGVVMQIPNVASLVEKTGASMITMKAGAKKDVGNMFRPLTESERGYLQSKLTTIHDEFISAVSQGRGLLEKKVREFADGRLILGSEALELGLIDGYGDVYDGARAVFELSGEPLPEDEMPKLYHPVDKFERFMRSLEVYWRLPFKLFFSERGQIEILLQSYLR